MAEPNHPPTDAEAAAELARVTAEPLLPVEKWLIGVSLASGVVLMGVLLWASRTYFPMN